MMKMGCVRLLAFAALALLLTGCARREEAGTDAARPNVVLVVIDALRADRLGCYGYARPTSPNLDALASDGVLFANAMAPGPETAVSIPSLMTGRWPWEHGEGWVRQRGTVYLRKSTKLPMLAEILKQHGYQTAAFCANPLLGTDTDAERGFELFDYPIGPLPVWLHGSAANVNAAAFQWLGRCDASRAPFLLYLHYIDPHNLYRPPEEFARFGRPGYTFADDARNVAMNEVFDAHEDTTATDRAFRARGVSRSQVERLSDLYDGEVLCADHAVGELLKQLKRRRLYDNTLIVVTADHGETFLDHGQLEHGGSLYQEMLGVPLLMRVPGLRGGQEVKAVVSTIDIAPTVLDAVGAGEAAEMSGRSVYPALVKGTPVGRRPELAALPARNMRAVRLGNLKLIESPGRVELYDLAADPKERHDLARSRPADVARLRGILAREVARHPAAAGAARPASPEEVEALRALGYVK